MGCRWCGIDQPDHADWWVPEVGWHRWTQPTQEQIKQRMRERRALRQSPARPSSPMGCRLCGIEQRGHGIQATAGGSHTWQQPTSEQIKQRMLARRQQATEELCSVQQQTVDRAQQMHAERQQLTDQADAYLTLQGIEESESQRPGCGWLPVDATTDCDWDPNCPVHGRTKG
jgi:hypothetical protein